MNRRIKVIGAFAVVALAATGCGGGGSTTGTTTDKTLIIGVDLPFQGSSKDASDDTCNAMQLYLDQVGNKAGNYKVKLKKYDDSTAAKGAWDDATCTKNANDHVANANEVAVMGTYNSGCAKLEVPMLNQAPERPDADGVARQHQPRSDQDLGPGRAGQVLPDRQAQLRPRGHHRRLSRARPPRSSRPRT